ncbi:alkaline phosphatase D [Marinitoga hydrogenitolerans DSM 16785]|uniref:Alkaline phosphatase D n=1 Tax=Marinitoga hydrogenitolerans (strain DSM 16785 / JCM 12826 / AT1271) TaxID=1122195 RepID=A0A1M4ZPS5_MARH1|nr:MoxR family ATPase [Marinitoga hydrogenitolerans]SHF19817.1 alkaline phosphatase D [Marinitoga hydrogenitolerans DSM 16785]
MKPSDIKFLSKKIMESREIPLIWGHFGVGKTDIARDIARETNRELIILVISQMEPGDLIGLPSRNEDKTVFLKPDWWPEKDNTIIMIDEINRAHRSIRNAIMQLLLDRKIHNHVLPDGTWIMAAANPPDDDYDQVDLITDPAFMSRFFHLSLNSSPEEWINWAENQNVSNEIISFIKEYPEFISNGKSVSFRLDLKPSPRSWYKLSRVLNNLTEDELKEYAYILSSGIVGPEAARTFVNHLENKSNLPTPKKILFDMDDIVFNRIKNMDIDKQNSIILRINKYFENLEEDDMIKILDNSEHKLIARNIKKLSMIISKDSAYSILRSIDHFASKNKGLKKAFFEKLFEELAIVLDNVNWLEEI